MSDEIAEILANCLERMEAGASLEACLADHPHQAAELEPLLRMTQQMSPLSKVGPRPFFAQNARQNLEKQLITPHQPVTFPRRSRHTRQEPKLLRQKRLNMSWLKLAIAAVLALTATTGGVAYAAHSSNPGDVLHGLDIAMENVQLNLAPDVASKVQLRLEFASERLAEAQQTFAENDVADGLEAMNEYGSEISAAAQLIGSADGADQEALLALLEAARGVHQDVLTQLLATVPDQAKDGIQKALDASDNHGKPDEAGNPNGTGNPNGSGNPANNPNGGGNPNDSDNPANPENPNGAGNPNETGNPNNGNAPGADIRACASSLSQETAQALVELAKQHGVDHQYVLQNFCVLGTLDQVREMLAGLENENVPTDVPAGPPSDVPNGPPDSVPGGPPDNVPGKP